MNHHTVSHAADSFLDPDYRPDLAGLSVYGADAWSFGTLRADNPFLPHGLQAEGQQATEARLSAGSWWLGWDKAAARPQFVRRCENSGATAHAAGVARGLNPHARSRSVSSVSTLNADRGRELHAAWNRGWDRT